MQHLTGALLQEVVAILPCEVTTNDDVGIYQPRSNRSAHLDRPTQSVLT